MRASTVNRTDCGYRAGHPFFIRLFSGVRSPKAQVWGTEFAGEVAGVGAGVKGFADGDRVFGYSEGTFGAHAEFMAVPADGRVAAVPEGWGFGEVAPAIEGWHYARANVEAVGAGAGSRILVNGGTGAIGSAAVQILKSRGAEVVAVCGPEHVGLVAELGADRVVDNSVVDFTTEGTRYDVVFDAVGKSTFGRCRSLLRPGGIYSTTDLGPGWQNPVLTLVTRLGRGRRVILPVPQSDPRLAERAGEMIEAGDFRPLIDSRRPLDGIVDAYRFVESGRKIGNVVLDVALDAPD